MHLGGGDTNYLSYIPIAYFHSLTYHYKQLISIHEHNKTHNRHLMQCHKYNLVPV